MCGIAGICRLDGQPLNEDARAHVRAMTDVITYRGPDGSGIWQEGPVSLGHRRLSIIDLSGGSQPMQDVDGELCIVFNGEIYNFAELRQELLQAGARFHSSHSDTEVILQAYRVWGTDCLQRFDGMFAFALWDAPRRRLFCARDRLAKSPSSTPCSRAACSSARSSTAWPPCRGWSSLSIRRPSCATWPTNTAHPGHHVPRGQEPAALALAAGGGRAPEHPPLLGPAPGR